jgi:hypothetical protein
MTTQKAPTPRNIFPAATASTTDDMTPWLKAWRADQKAGLGDWTGHDQPSEAQ